MPWLAAQPRRARKKAAGLEDAGGFSDRCNGLPLQ
jgi:hypothetical protein